jgi:Zn-dependent peptidase ImmA (M78 family)
MSEGADKARLAREQLGLGQKAAIPDLLGLIEGTAGVPVVVAQLGNEGIAGAYVRRRDTPFILLNGSNKLVRLRFTLAHEYGHHALAHGQGIDKVIDLASNAPHEREANIFAAEFLLPIEAVNWWASKYADREIDLSYVVTLAQDFGVSAQVARYRLQAAGQLRNRGVCQELDEAIADGEHLTTHSFRTVILPEGLREARKRKRRLPAAAEEILVKGWEKAILSDEQVAERLQVAKSDLPTVGAAYKKETE